MNPRTIVAVILITLGVVVIACSGITFSTRGKPVDLPGLHIQTTRQHFIPPVVGAVALAVGIGLLLVKSKNVP